MDPLTGIAISAAAKDALSWVDWKQLARQCRSWREGGRTYGTTLPLLHDRARFDENYDVRRAAVQELQRGWKGDPAVQQFLSELP